MSDPAQNKKPDFNSLDPEQKAKVFFAKATKVHQDEKLDEAIKLYAQAVAYHPAFPDAYNNMAVALRKQLKFDAALACYKRSLAIRNDHGGTYSNLGNVLNDMDLVDQSVEAHAKAVELEPDNLLFLYNKGLVLRDAGKLDEAIEQFDDILQKEPGYKDCRWDRAITLLMRGDLKEGFKEYDSRWELPHSPPRKFKKPRWDGTPLGKKRLFIHREQGFGDAIQFARILPAIKERFGGYIILECQPDLVDLFQGLEGVDQLHAFGKRPPDFDCWIPLMSLASILEIDQKNIPGEIPFIFGPSETRFRIRSAPEKGLNIGIVWAGSPTHKNDRRRSIEVSRFFDLIGYEGVTVFSLQKGDRVDDLKSTGGVGLFINAGQEIKNFYDTAAVIDQLDLVISVDTSVVHLAAAMGKEVWALIPFTPDWRWMMKRKDSPWYPTLKLYRQKKPGDWDRVFKEVYRDLDKKLARLG